MMLFGWLLFYWESSFLLWNNNARHSIGLPHSHTRIVFAHSQVAKLMFFFLLFHLYLFILSAWKCGVPKGTTLFGNFCYFDLLNIFGRLWRILFCLLWFVSKKVFVILQELIQRFSSHYFCALFCVFKFLRAFWVIFFKADCLIN